METFKNIIFSDTRTGANLCTTPDRDRKLNILSQMAIPDAFTILSRFYSEEKRYKVEDLIYYATNCSEVPLAIISNNRERAIEMVDFMSRDYAKLEIVDNVKEIFRVARNVKFSTTIRRKRNDLNSKFFYPKSISLLSTMIGFDLLNDKYIYKFPSSTAVVKCNVFLRDVIIDVLSEEAEVTAGFIITLVKSGLVTTHNAFCAAILFLVNFEKRYKDSGITNNIGRLLMALLNPETRKKVIEDTSMLKTLGAQKDDILIMLCELKCLLGKEPPSADFIGNDLRHRLDSENENYFINKDNVFQLKTILEKMYHDSVGEFTVQELETYWENRWARCKSGAHKVRDEIRSCGSQITKVDQPTRRNFIEEMEDNVLFKTKPLTLISPSCKNENGKNRVIYSCDTINYLNFDYFIQHIESNWYNKNVVLKPSDYTDHKRHMDLLNSSRGWFFSLDYDDFNSQHSKIAMKTVVDVFSRRFSQDIREWLLASFDNMELSISGKKWYGTLPSGHRLTSFINSVLNYAYLEMVINISYYESYHTGDDCIIMLNSLKDAEVIVKKLYVNSSSKIRVNKDKQIVGDVGEFLRHSYWIDARGYNVRSYFSRSIASLVNGNWTSANRLEPDEYINAVSEIIHTIRTRIHSQTVYGLNTTLARRLNLSYEQAYSYLHGTLSINRSPVASTGQNVDCCDLNITCRNRFKEGNKCYASAAYLRMLERKRPILFSKIKRYKRILLRRMVDMSLLDKREVISMEKRLYKLNPPSVDRIDIASIDLKSRMDGYLSNVMPFPIIKRLLSQHEITEIVKQLGKEIMNYDRDIWGYRSNTVFYETWLSYKDLKVIGHSVTSFVRVTSREINY